LILYKKKVFYLIYVLLVTWMPQWQHAVFCYCSAVVWAEMLDPAWWMQQITVMATISQDIYALTVYYMLLSAYCTPHKLWAIKKRIHRFFRNYVFPFLWFTDLNYSLRKICVVFSTVPVVTSEEVYETFYGYKVLKDKIANNILLYFPVTWKAWLSTLSSRFLFKLRYLRFFSPWNVSLFISLSWKPRWKPLSNTYF